MSEVTVYLKVIASIVILSILVFLFIKSKDNWILQVYKKIFTDNPGIASSNIFTVNHLAKPPGIFNIFSPKETGIITIRENTVSFLGYQSENKPVRLQFPVDKLETVWVGKLNSLSRSYWFLFKHGDEKHYFCAETGERFPNSETVSKEIFENIKKQLG